MTSRTYTIALAKSSKRAINKAVLQKQIDYAKERITASDRGKKGWTVESSRLSDRYNLTDTNDTFLVHECTLTLQCTPRSPRTTYDDEFSNIIIIVRGALRTHQWEINKIDDKDPPPETAFNSSNPDLVEESTYINVNIPQTWQDAFAHLYERDAHINIIHDAIEIAIESNWKHRFHVLLFGSPGCGKTDICLSVKEMVGAESVLEFDATSTTSAGAIANLRERRDALPRLILIEEIEKADEGSLRWLLGLLGMTGNVRKLTYRNKTEFDARMLCIATVNDIDLFKRMMSGALASRFPHQLYCSRPNRALLGKILEREVSGIDGDEAWIEPTLDYLDRHDITDPRKAMAICLTGRDRLLNGEFQRQMDKTIEPPSNALDNVRKLVR